MQRLLGGINKGLVARGACAAALVCAVAGAALLSTVGCTSSRPVARPEPTLALPSPLLGPGVPELENRNQRQLEDAWQQLQAGQAARARALATAVEPSAPATLLELQSELVDAEQLDSEPELLPRLKQLIDLVPDYAAAWLTLSMVAEQQADEYEALDAARKGASLWPRSSWSGRADTLYQGWVVDRITRATQQVTDAAFSEALALVERALSLDPGNRNGLLTKARALIGLEQLGDAELVLTGLGSDPEAIYLAATIAEQREDWLTAMDLYSGLPEDYPGRDRRLRETQLRWRLSHQPARVKAALGSEHLTRAELAVLIAALAPQLEGMRNGSVPVLSDIVDEPGRREILTVVRVGILDVDRLEHRFDPSRFVNEGETRAALERLLDLLGRPAPIWCNEPNISSSCDMMALPISGAEVASVILDRAQEETP